LLEVALVENLQREDLSPIEEASAYRALIDELDLTQEEVAERVGRERTTVTNMLRLLSLPSRIQDLVQSGELSVGHAKALGGLGSPRAQVELAERIVREGLSVRRAEALAGQGSRSGEAWSRKRAIAIDPNVAAAEQSLERALATQVRILAGRRGGRIEIRYHDGEELRRLYDLLAREGGSPTR
jgi:ParB family chromosome partitioning protein